MLHETKKYLYDVLQACDAILQFTAGKTMNDYDSDLLLRSAVERQLMIIGEAINQASKVEPTLSESITSIRRIINLRNVIVHGYATVENQTIWGILQQNAPVLHRDVTKLLQQ